MKKYIWTALALALSVACATVPQAPAPVVPLVTSQFWKIDAVACADAGAVPFQCSSPIGAAVIEMHGPDGYISKHGDGAGYAVFTLPAGFADSDVVIDAPGYLTARAHIDVAATHDSQRHNIITLASAHFDPSTLSLEQLVAMMKGSMWTSRLNLPYGPRPGQDSNILPMAFYELYSPADQARMLKHYHDEQGYTAAVTGPVTGNDCYHGLYPCRQTVPTQAQWDAYLDTLQDWWDRDIAPVYFGKPDGAEDDAVLLAQLDALEQQPRAQKLIRIVIEPGWEPSGTKYGWKNETYVRMLQRGAVNFPNALRGLHTVSDLDAPIGGDDDPVAHMPNNKSEAWRRVMPFIHFWAVQIGGYVDGGSPTPTPQFLSEFAKVWGDYNRRFQTDAGGWNFPSAWSGGRPLLVGYAEGAAYGDFWRNWPESVSLDLGDLAIVNGAAFCMDGCRVPVPVRQ